MRIASKLYQLARFVNTIEALTSFDSKRIQRRIKNIAMGRLAGHTKIWKKIYS